MDTKFNTISIHGAPRSGTSWLGQIFNSHPDVSFRFQPLFSYRFKDRINSESTHDDLIGFLQELFNLKDDSFILNFEEVEKGIYPKFSKSEIPRTLVMKMVRYHYMISKFLDEVDDFKVIGIVRNPYAVLSSWAQAPKEFNPEWDILKEWRFADQKNSGRLEEYYGYERWKDLAKNFLKLRENYSDRFFLVRYEDLVRKPHELTLEMFEFANMQFDIQTQKFLENCHKNNDVDPYSVYKIPSSDGWREVLTSDIIEEIARDLSGTQLEEFIN